MSMPKKSIERSSPRLSAEECLIQEGAHFPCEKNVGSPKKQVNAKRMRVRRKKHDGDKNTLPAISDGSIKHWNAVGSYEELVKAVAEKGGAVVSAEREYRGSSKPVLVSCEMGHEWSTTLYRLRNRANWCPVCAKQKLKSERREAGWARCEAFARSRGGQFLSQSYMGTAGKHWWKCSEKGHPDWQARADAIFVGKWCPLCRIENPDHSKAPATLTSLPKVVMARKGGRRPTYALGDVIKLANAKKGECLSLEFHGWVKHHEFKCERGHQWMAAPAKINKGQWCPVCARLRSRARGLSDLQAWAQAQGGQCLSDSYEGSYKKHIWKCHNASHPAWSAQPSKVMGANQWCPYCGNAKATVEQYHKIAKSRGGEMVGAYLDTLTPIEWTCAKGHTFEKAPERVKQGRWCPHCWGKGESLVREVLEGIFNVSLPVSRPDWLKENPDNPSERNWSLDGLNMELGMAFEYQGSLHLKFNAHFHDSVEDFEKIRARDKRKVEICRDKSVALLVINQIQKITVANAVRAIEKELNAKKEALSEEARKRFDLWQSVQRSNTVFPTVDSQALKASNK